LTKLHAAAIDAPRDEGHDMVTSCLAGNETTGHTSTGGAFCRAETLAYDHRWTARHDISPVRRQVAYPGGRLAADQNSKGPHCNHIGGADTASHISAMPSWHR